MNTPSHGHRREEIFPGLAQFAGDFTALQLELDPERPDRIHVRLHRPEVRNAIDETMAGELHAVCAWLERHPRTLIISGTEITDPKTGQTRGIFASGADIRELRDRCRDEALHGVNARAFDRIHQLPMPVIAALDGYALGGGAELSYAADFRLATPHVKFGQPETGLGIIAAAGALWRLKELIGEPIALEMLLAGRILGAEEAKALDLVSAIHPPGELLDAAHALADRIAAQDPLAVRLSKKVFHMPRDAHPHVEELAQAIAFESEAKFDRMQTFLNRKK